MGWCEDQRVIARPYCPSGVLSSYYIYSQSGPALSQLSQGQVLARCRGAARRLGGPASPWPCWRCSLRCSSRPCVERANLKTKAPDAAPPRWANCCATAPLAERCKPPAPAADAPRPHLHLRLRLRLRLRLPPPAADAPRPHLHLRLRLRLRLRLPQQQQRRRRAVKPRPRLHQRAPTEDTHHTHHTQRTILHVPMLVLGDPIQ